MQQENKTKLLAEDTIGVKGKKMRDNLTDFLINGLSAVASVAATTTTTTNHSFRRSTGIENSISGSESDGLFTVLSSTLTTALPPLFLGSGAPPNRSMTGTWDGDSPPIGENFHSNFTVCPSTEMPWSNVVFMLLYSVVAIVGLLGNTLVIYVVLRFSNMQTVTNMYILVSARERSGAGCIFIQYSLALLLQNLAIADECFLVGIPFIIATMNLGRWPFGTIICKAYMVSTSITQFTSSIFLLVMSTDRYIAICHHVSSPKYRTPMVSRIVSAVAWITSALIMLPIMMYATTIEMKPNTFTCHILWPEDGQTGAISFILYSFTLGFAIPLCFIMTFYCLVIRKLRSLSKKTNKSHNKRRSHRKVTKLVLTVITVYVLCWLPYWTSQMALIANPESCNTRLSITIFLFVGCLGYSNSAINPILYAYLSDNFKKSFLKACVCAGPREVNAQLKVENSVLPRKSRNGKRLNSDFGTTTMISSTVAGAAATAKNKNHRTFQAETTLGTSGTTTTTTSISMLPSSVIPSPSAVVPPTIAPPVAINHNLTNQNGHHQQQKQQQSPLNDYHQEMAAISYRDKLHNHCRASLVVGEEELDNEDDGELNDSREQKEDEEVGGGDDDEADDDNDDDEEDDERFGGRVDRNLIKI